MSDFFPTKPDRRYPSTCHLFADYHIPINSKRTITVRKYPSKVFPKMPHLVLRIPRTCGQSQPKLPSNVGRAKILPKVDMGLFSGENTNGFGPNFNPFLLWYGYSRSVQDLRSSQLVKHWPSTYWWRIPNQFWSWNPTIPHFGLHSDDFPIFVGWIPEIFLFLHLISRDRIFATRMQFKSL